MMGKQVNHEITEGVPDVVENWDRSREQYDDENNVNELSLDNLKDSVNQEEGEDQGYETVRLHREVAQDLIVHRVKCCHMPKL